MAQTLITAVDPVHLADAQRRRLGRFGIGHSADVHCHCLPCVDDGPGTLVEAVELCRALVSDGVTAVITTPHQLGRYEGRNGAAAVREAVAALNRELLVEGIPLRVYPGADVRIDERLERLLDADQVLTLADGGTYLLLELPHDTYIDPLPLLRRLVKRGLVPILSHPERHAYLTDGPNGTRALEAWVRAGAVVQVTAGSITGDFGSAARRAAHYWVSAGLAGIVATDSHGATRRPPRMSAALDEIVRGLGEPTARRVCLENPLRVIEGRPLLGPPAREDPLLDL